MQPKIKIHFVCRGNVFRSRLAEAYARSLKGDDWEVSSSGVFEDRYPRQTLSPWAKIIAHKHGFDGYFSAGATQTTSELLNGQDIIVFMKKNVFHEALQNYKFNQGKCLVWNINDREDWPKSLSLPQKRTRTFKHLRRDVEQLIKDVGHSRWIDIVDERNTPLHYSLPITVANKNGLWHRTCHAIITTPSKHTLVQKRSSRIVFAPGLLDISMGGHVDKGESPEQAILREIREEIGLNAGNLKLLEVHKQASYHPRYKRYSKSFTYSYHAPIHDENPILKPERSEVAKLEFVDSATLHRLVKRRKLKSLGRLNYTYKFYRRNVELAGL